MSHPAVADALKGDPLTFTGLGVEGSPVSLGRICDVCKDLAIILVGTTCISPHAPKASSNLKHTGNFFFLHTKLTVLLRKGPKNHFNLEDSLFLLGRVS